MTICLLACLLVRASMKERLVTGAWNTHESWGDSGSGIRIVSRGRGDGKERGGLVLTGLRRTSIIDYHGIMLSTNKTKHQQQ